jgi:hypothetical protein
VPDGSSLLNEVGFLEFGELVVLQIFSRRDELFKLRKAREVVVATNDFNLGLLIVVLHLYDRLRLIHRHLHAARFDVGFFSSIFIHAHKVVFLDWRQFNGGATALHLLLWRCL